MLSELGGEASPWLRRFDPRQLDAVARGDGDEFSVLSSRKSGTIISIVGVKGVT